MNTLYWEKELETMNRKDLEILQLSLFKEKMQYVYDRSPMYQRKFDQAGIKPDDIRTFADIRNVPFTVKEDLRESQEIQPPWGDCICIPPEEGVRVERPRPHLGVHRLGQDAPLPFPEALETENDLLEGQHGELPDG